MLLDDFKPEVIVGIANGGVRVVGVMPTDSTPTYICRMRRPGTATKERFGLHNGVLRRLPYVFADLLRSIENWIQSRRPIVVPDATSQLQADVDVLVSSLQK